MRAHETNPDTHPQSSQNHSVDSLLLDGDTTSSSANVQQIPNTKITTELVSPVPFKVLPEFKAAVDNISAITRTTITLLLDHTQILPPGRKTISGFGRQGMVELQVAGTWENAEAARMLLLVVIDTLKPGVVADKLNVELKFQNMIGGKKRQVLQELMSKTNTRIYLTSPLVQTANKSGTPIDSRYNEIYITGEAAQVATAKEVLSQAYYRVRTTSLSCTRQVNIATRKLDWMLLNHRERLRSIMIDNATFIALPPLGGTHPTISVYGETSVNVERTIRTIMQLSCRFHSGSITMRDVPLSVQAQQSLPSFLNICKNISQVSGSEVEFRNNGFLMFGSGSQVRTAMQYLTETDIIKTLPFEFKFSVELSNEHREFISGKKNGKINRIMKATGAKIKFDQCNEYNFYVDLSSSVAAKSMEALVLLQEELPAEISFFVPESCHKRIIGVGGKNIQRIMKKYGVYVKFSNFEEYATLGGYFDNLDNVVARTPSKNSVNLLNLKQGVMDLINAKDKDFECRHLLIPRNLHLFLMCDNSALLCNIHEITNATILFPAPETGSDNITVSGPESLIQQAIEMLLGVVEEQYVFPVNQSESIDAILETSEFKSEVVNVIKKKWQMDLTFSKVAGPGAAPRFKGIDNPNNSEEWDQKGDRPTCETVPVEDAFIFKYTRNHEENLGYAKNRLVEFLSNHNIEVHMHEQNAQRTQSNSLKDPSLCDATRLPSADYLPDCHNLGSSDYVLFDNTGSTFDSIIEGSGPIGSGSVASSDMRSRFSQGLYSGFNSLDNSPRWTDHSRHLSTYSASSSTSSPGLSASSVPLGVSGISQSPGSPSIFARPTTSSAAEIWTSGKPQRQSQTSGNHLGSIGDLRTTSSGHYSPSGHSHQHHPSLLSSDVPLNKAAVFHTSGSNGAGGRYSGGNSPVQNGVTTNLSSHGNPMSRQGSPQHTPNQRNPSGSSVNRNSVQFIEDSILSGQTFGAGYGPSLNSGGGRFAHQQHLVYQQSQQQGQYVTQNQPQSLHQFPQHGIPGLPFAPHLQPQNGFGYPQQRQRHSSQNSAASHHTLGLGPIGRGPGSAGGSVNSDEVSTEDDSDEVFDEMRNRYRMQSAPATMFQQSHLLQQGSASSGLGGYEGYSSHNSSSSSLLNRRGSGGSAHSINFHQQQPFYSQKSLDYSTNRSSSSHDLFSQYSLVNAMEKHTLNGQAESDLGAAGGRSSSQGGQSQNHGLSGTAKNTNNVGPLTGASRFDDEHGFFSNGFGGIIGDRTQAYGHINGNLNGSTHPAGGMRSQLPSQLPLHRGSNTGFVSNLSFNNDGDIFGGENIDRSRKSVNSTLSASASPFYIDSPMSNEQTGNHSGESGRWDY
ncbi:hypothetical protein BGZ76_011604 [Entomortierella beljakovae]|nr:hypothetical protein BGZ76_011604 [Entomortierella beljakovae]